MRIRRLSLVYPFGFQPLPVVALGTAPVEIGREPHGDPFLRLSDPQVSRRHAVLELDPTSSAFWLSDLQSRNGTFLNGERVVSARLENGAVIGVGRALAVFSDVEVAAGDPSGSGGPTLRGDSLAMRALRGRIQSLASGGGPVLILGETGSGRETVARQLHRLSGRDGPFVAVDCGALPPLEAEARLFGGDPAGGARSRGLFAGAENGTLYLREVGALPLPAQDRLREALAPAASGTASGSAPGEPAGSRAPARVVVSSQSDLGVEVFAGRFRSELFELLKVQTLLVPPLRQRRDDILVMARGILDAHGAPFALSHRAAEALLVYNWPRNIRELQEVVSASFARARGGSAVRLEHLPDGVRPLHPPVRPRNATPSMH